MINIIYENCCNCSHFPYIKKGGRGREGGKERERERGREGGGEREQGVGEGVRGEAGGREGSEREREREGGRRFLYFS